ncbi:MAG: hypothetical protein QG637_1875 [Chloroflexota bacterium]|nr:hypothetical protein [Chloroflexota bacterium]
MLARDARLFQKPFHRDLHTLLTLAGHPHPDAALAPLGRPAETFSKQPAGRADWGRSPDVGHFVGRSAELAQLRSWLADPACRLANVFSLGSIGKTFLTKRTALDAAPTFAATKWMLLQDGPPLHEVLAECLHLFSGYRGADLFGAAVAETLAAVDSATAATMVAVNAVAYS